MGMPPAGDEPEVPAGHAIEIRTGPVHASRKATAGLNSRIAIPRLGLTPYRAPLDVRRVGGGLAGDRTPLVLGDQARLEQLETVEEAQDLIPAPRPDPLAGPLIHRHRLGQGRLIGEEVSADM